jgi:AcrR family transcriptional regulator
VDRAQLRLRLHTTAQEAARAFRISLRRKRVFGGKEGNRRYGTRFPDPNHAASCAARARLLRRRIEIAVYDPRFRSARSRGRPATHELISRADTLRAAQEVFTQRGYHAATLQEIAKHVGATRSAIIYHFRSKRQLYEEVLITADRSLRLIIDDSLTARSLVDQLRSFITALSDHPAFAAFLINAAADIKRHPREWPAWLDIPCSIRRFVATALHDAARRGELSSDPTPSVVDLVTAMLMGVLFETAFPLSPPPNELFSQFVALLAGTWR